MKNSLILIICGWLNLTAFAQGLVVFANTASTPVIANVNWASGDSFTTIPINGQGGSWYFALLTSVSGLPGTFAFSGIVSGWAPGKTMFYEVAGWSASLGPTWQLGWLDGNFGGKAGILGISSSGSGVAGGGIPPASPFPLFGGTGINQGFSILLAIPEPRSIALAGLAFALLLVSHLRTLWQSSHGEKTLVRLNKSLEQNCGGIRALEGRDQAGRSVYARGSRSSAVAHFNRQAARLMPCGAALKKCNG